MHTTVCDENQKSLRQITVLIALSGFLIVAFNTKLSLECFKCMIVLFFIFTAILSKEASNVSISASDLYPG